MPDSVTVEPTDTVLNDADPPTVKFVPTDNAPEYDPEPTTSRATVGAVVPIPKRLENEAVPAVKI